MVGDNYSLWRNCDLPVQHESEEAEAPVRNDDLDRRMSDDLDRTMRGGWPRWSEAVKELQHFRMRGAITIGA